MQGVMTVKNRSPHSKIALVKNHLKNTYSKCTVTLPPSTAPTILLCTRVYIYINNEYLIFFYFIYAVTTLNTVVPVNTWPFFKIKQI